MRKYLFHAAALAISAALLWFGTAMRDEMARVLLEPYRNVAQAFFNTEHLYVENTGYVETGGRYTIGRDCLGLNFTALFFAISTLPFLHKLGVKRRLLWLLLCFPASVAVGFVLNSVRILGSIPFALHDKFNLIHAAMGIALYLFAVTFSYAAICKTLERKPVL